MNKFDYVKQFFKEQDLFDYPVINYYYERALEEKLWDYLDEKGEMVFKYPVNYFNIDRIKGGRGKSGIIKLIGKRQEYEPGQYVYEYYIILDDNTKLHLIMNDTSTVGGIIDELKSEKRWEERIKKTAPIVFKDEDIIITDPCYIRREDSCDDWEKCEYGQKMEELGITNYLTHDTIYGDWSCTTFNSDTHEPLGQFCADAGLVSVFSLDEVRRYNPDIDKFISEHSWCVTKISNFTGEVWIDVEHVEGTYEDTTEYHKAGEKWEDWEVHVVGKGNINFITSQTGL